MTTLSPGRTIGGLNVLKVSTKTPLLNILIYGDSGAGKTVLAGSADDVPEMRKVLMVDLEGGTESLRTTYPNVDVVRIPSWKEMQQVYNELHRGGHGYNTVIIDSLTEVMKFNMYDIMQDLVKRKTDDEKYVDPDIPSVREWGKNIEQLRKFIRAFRDLPMHTIFTALPKVDEDKRTGARTILPSLAGKLAQESAAFLDVVGYYYIKEIQADGAETEFRRLLLTQKTSSIVAKDRTAQLPQVMQYPTMAKLYAAMYNDKAKDQTNGA